MKNAHIDIRTSKEEKELVRKVIKLDGFRTIAAWFWFQIYKSNTKHMKKRRI